ncbi:flavodoxin domain-containing protein [Candidatus Latescibacterota bacterium]
MKNLIIYETHHGCTEKCAVKLRDQLQGETGLLTVKQASCSALDDYDTVIIGGSIHAGRIQKKIRVFCHDHLASLLEKKLGLFICCMEEGKTAQRQFDNAYPEVLRQHATASGLFGGELDIQRMNFIERFIVKKVAKVDRSISKINDESIEMFARSL